MYGLSPSFRAVFRHPIHQYKFCSKKRILKTSIHVNGATTNGCGDRRTTYESTPLAFTPRAVPYDDSNLDPPDIEPESIKAGKTTCFHIAIISTTGSSS